MSKSILSVNNNRAMNFLLQTIFEKEYKFIPTLDVFHATHQLKSAQNISAIIIDIDFQSNQGWDLIQHIKSSKLFNIPVIVLTSLNSEDLKQKCYEFEVDEIFFKPFNPVDLIAAVKSVVSSVNLSKV
ncbi:MAG: hypothetical protein NVS1B13_10450 [Flavisolibacter sp.]